MTNPIHWLLGWLSDKLYSNLILDLDWNEDEDVI